MSGGRHRVTGGRVGSDQQTGSRQGAARWTPQRIAMVLVVVAALATIPFGGWSAADGTTGKLPRLAVDEVSEGLPWNVTVTGGRLLDDQPPLHASEPGNRWVIILATVEVTADTSRIDIVDALRISGADGLVDDGAPGTVAVVSDFAEYPYLHPGLAEAMLFAWEQSATAPVPTEVEVTIFGKTLGRDSLTGMRQWMDRAPRAVVSVPIVDRRGA